MSRQENGKAEHKENKKDKPVSKPESKSESKPGKHNAGERSAGERSAGERSAGERSAESGVTNGLNSDYINDQTLHLVLDDFIESAGRFQLTLESGQVPQLNFSNTAATGLIYSALNSANLMYSQGISQVITELFQIDARVEREGRKTEEDRDIKTVTCTVKFTSVKVEKPTYVKEKGGSNNAPVPLYPYTCRKSHLDYAAPMKISARITACAYLNNGEKREQVFEVHDHSLGNVPIMVLSENCNLHGSTPEGRARLKEDPNDPGGYFIIGGQEWVVSMIESVIYNQPRIFRNIGHQKEIARCEIISKPGEAYEHSFETIIVFHDDGNISVELKSNKNLKDIHIPFYIVFRMLGMNLDKEIVDNIVYGYSDYSADVVDEVSDIMVKRLKAAFQAPTKHFSLVRDVVDQAELIRGVAQIVNNITMSKRTSLADQDQKYEDNTEALMMNMLKTLDGALLPHVGSTPQSRHEKCRYLGHLIHKTFLVSEQIASPTDRDSIAEKRIHAAGHAFIKIFKRVFNYAVVKKIRTRLLADLKSTPFNQLALNLCFTSALQGKELERMLSQAIIEGKKDKPSRGRNQASMLTSELLVRKNQLNFLSTLRVVRTNSLAATKMAQRGEEMRQAHPSYPPFIDMIQSADTGEQVGMVRQICLGNFICESGSSGYITKTLLKDSDLIPLEQILPSAMAQSRYTKVLVNGKWIACTRAAPRVLRRYLEARRGWEPVSEKRGKDEKIPFLEKPAVTKRAKVGFTREKPAVYTEFRHRGMHLISPMTTLYWDTDSDELHFWTENSRILTLVLVVRNNGELDPVGQQILGSQHNPYKPASESGFVQDIVLTKEDIIKLKRRETSVPRLVMEGKLEYISPQETKKSVLAGSIVDLKRHRHDPLRPYTHCQIPASILGLPALTCPFAHCNQVPRIIFQTNQSKQTCGIPFKNYPYRADKHSFIQYEVNAPLVQTMVNKYLNPNGMNTIVAVAAYDYNEEDSLVNNESSAQRGFFSGEHYNFTRRVLQSNEVLGTPDRSNTANMKDGLDYSVLRDVGYPKVGQIVTQHMPIIGVKLIEPQRPNTPRSYVDKSVFFKYTEKSMVTSVVRSKDRDGANFCKVVVSAVRQLGPGEKFSSRHGQKGMIGKAINQADMLFSSRGIVPNLVLSPHAIPSPAGRNRFLVTEA